ncbi:Flp pilus assembly protein CpaB [Shewanella sp. 4_MG-2023]|uniref:Flp pilus assembly protein CpaB n=1 Tax=Shewanella sp. 4_MG-2023 TaxID=3062652 RepID=UPI0026E2060A|nr:Flp pilus assembly protein CpaB [Shewanella sp. 4_MG-2023]MDO6678125.1 Flp pilus assembly protein CpaB [Shewanella sp. 4_MG-2023]
MNSKTIMFIVLSLVFGAIAVFLAQNWLKSNTPMNHAGQTTTVVTLSSLVPMGTIIDRKHMVLTTVPEDIAPKGSVTKFEDAEGKVVNQKLYSGEILRHEKLTTKGEGSTLASLIQHNMRAVTIRVNDVVGVAGFLLPGNRVDVINLYKEGNYKTDIVLSNVKILAIDQQASNDENKPMLVRAVTLELSMEQAELLLIAKGRGSLQLALRNPNDNAQVEVASLNQDSKLQEKVLMTKAIQLEEVTPSSTPLEKVVFVQSNTKAKVLVLKGMNEQEIKVNN